MAALTKTQINYFTKRMGIMCNRLIGAFEEQCKVFLPKPMSVSEKAHLILSGKAEPNFEYLSSRKDDYTNLGYVADAFIFPGACEAEKKAKQAGEDLKKYIDHIRSVKETICDDFVIGTIHDPDIVVQTFMDRLPSFIADFRHKYNY